MISVVCPAYNEAGAVGPTVDRLHAMLKAWGKPYEIIVVDDGSTDGTGAEAARHGATVITRPQNFGYGAALKAGITAAQYEWIVITDTDGTYPIEEIPQLLSFIPTFDMVVGQRTGAAYRGSFLKFPARKAFQWLSEFVVGRKIPDVNSGLRIFRRDAAMQHFHRISGGFSFTTTLTLAAMTNGWSVQYVPIPYHRREGKSKVRMVRDTLRSSQIIVEAILAYNPIKLFLLLTAFCWLLGAGLTLASALTDRHPLWVGSLAFFAGVLVLAIGLGVAGMRNALTSLAIITEQATKKER